METKYGPIAIHQNGIATKQLSATPTPVLAKQSRIAHSLENVRLSMHVERFESQEKHADEIFCIIRFPEYGYELKHLTPCVMRAGQTHGAAVVPATCICVDFEDAHDTEMEVEYSLGEEFLAKTTIPVRFPSAEAPEPTE